jgi:hypothetical protein
VEALKKYPPRYTAKPYRWEEEAVERYMRVCPGCIRPLRWLHYPKLLRMDPPQPSNDLDEIVWVTELQAYLVARYMEIAMPQCPMHGPVDWWLIRDTKEALLVGVASDHPTFWPAKPVVDDAGRPVLDRKGVQKMEHPEGGKLFRSPIRSTRLLLPRLLRSRSCRYAGRWKMKERNKEKPVVVGSGRQMRLWG